MKTLDSLLSKPKVDSKLSEEIFKENQTIPNILDFLDGQTVSKLRTLSSSFNKAIVQNEKLKNKVINSYCSKRAKGIFKKFGSKLNNEVKNKATNSFINFLKKQINNKIKNIVVLDKDLIKFNKFLENETKSYEFESKQSDWGHTAFPKDSFSIHNLINTLNSCNKKDIFKKYSTFKGISDPLFCKLLVSLGLENKVYKELEYNIGKGNGVFDVDKHSYTSL